jgi:3-oxoacyl-[acyl-carrier-protein] synthase-3
MKFSNVVLEKMAYSLPDEEWTSEFIEQQLQPVYERLKLPEGRLELMTGIKARRFWKDEIRPSEASSLAGKKLLEELSIDKGSIDVLIHCSVCRDRLEPATASYVHRNLGLHGNTQILDISNACLGFLNALCMAGGLIESGQAKRVMIVAGENGKPLLKKTIEILQKSNFSRKEIKPYFANLTIGAGCVAATICHRDLVQTNEWIKIDSVINETDSSYNHLCEGDSSDQNSLDMQTDSEELLFAGIATAERAWKRFKHESGWSESTADKIFCHQVGKAHRNLLFEKLKLDLKKDYSTFENLGNVGSVSVPITLATGWEQKVIHKGSRIALLGIGSGLSSIMVSGFVEGK